VYKDFVLRYYRLKGYNVWAQAGWDEQGLPVEVEVEKKLGVRRKKEISERVGLERFVKECNNLVEYYLRYWKDYVTVKLGLWLDLDNAYETRRARYIQYVWHLIKEAWRKGLLYEGFRVLPFCPRCETALSDAEVDQGYQEKVSPSIYVKFKVSGSNREYLVIWTTTPWTLIDNEAVAVKPDGIYCRVRIGDETWIVAKNLVDDVMRKAGVPSWECVSEFRGEALKGLRYVHPLLEEVPIHKDHVNAHKVVLADFVSLEEGTGLVHIAPGHGPEDFEVGLTYGLPITSNVEINGVFNELGGLFKGLYVDEASKKVVEVLREKGLLIHEGVITHSYPHCWRCHTPLIYRADKQWYLRVSSLRGELLRALGEVEIFPEKLRARFENWLANIKDWTISRSRIWGTPLPIWRCREDPNKVLVIGSIEELKRYSLGAPNVSDDDMVHRPWIDRVRLATNECREWVREPYVLDVWLDSGIAWIASVDGLRNKELFTKLFPYNFVTEGIDQTRGWFYSLIATSVILTGRAPYKQILMQGLVLDKFGRKMSKHLGNVVWAKDILEKYGADPLRLYILSKYPPGEPFMFDPDEVKEAVSKLNIIWNVFRFALTYMKLDRFTPRRYPLKSLIHLARKEDLWILSRVNSMLRRYNEAVRSYELHKATREVMNFFIEDVSHGYLRLARPRVWREEGNDKYVVYSVLYYVLMRALKALAPIVPHFSEALWQEFFRVIEPDLEVSIHLSVMEPVDEGFINSGLEEAFAHAFNVVSLIASLRNSVGIKLRWPVREVVVLTSDSELAKALNEVRGVLEFLGNVKSVRVVTEEPLECLGGNYVTAEAGGVRVYLPRTLDKDLYYEALARELIRRAQVMRNLMNLNVEEYVVLGIDTSDEDIAEALRRHMGFIANEVRARKVVTTVTDDMFSKSWVIEGMKVRIGIRRLG